MGLVVLPFHAMGIHVEQCYWNGSRLIVESNRGSHSLPSGDGIKALKQNRVQLVDVDGVERGYALFGDGENPRRFRLLQQALSLERD